MIRDNSLKFGLANVSEFLRFPPNLHEFLRISVNLFDFLRIFPNFFESFRISANFLNFINLLSFYKFSQVGIFVLFFFNFFDSEKFGKTRRISEKIGKIRKSTETFFGANFSEFFPNHSQNYMTLFWVDRKKIEFLNLKSFRINIFFSLKIKVECKISHNLSQLIKMT